MSLHHCWNVTVFTLQPPGLTIENFLIQMPSLSRRSVLSAPYIFSKTAKGMALFPEVKIYWLVLLETNISEMLCHPFLQLPFCFSHINGRSALCAYYGMHHITDMAGNILSRTTIMILSFRRGRSGQTVQTQIRLLLEQSGSTLFAMPSAILYSKATLFKF